jgi:transcriptional regulator with XRE-family HTH domain
MATLRSGSCQRRTAMSRITNDNVYYYERMRYTPPVETTVAAGELGSRLRELRTRQALSLSEAARRASISKAYLSQLEHGESTQPSYDVLGRIATALGTTAEVLAGRSSANRLWGGRIPDALRAFADNNAVPDGDVSMLAQIHYRGKQPETAEDWAHIYETIKRTIR